MACRRLFICLGKSRRCSCLRYMIVILFLPVLFRLKVMTSLEWPIPASTAYHQDLGVSGDLAPPTGQYRRTDSREEIRGPIAHHHPDIRVLNVIKPQEFPSFVINAEINGKRISLSSTVPPTVLQSDTWQPVMDPKSKSLVYIYSAYLDNRTVIHQPTLMVRIMGVCAPPGELSPLQCVFYTRSGVFTEDAMEAFRIAPIMRYHSCILNCPIHRITLSDPESYVSVSSAGNTDVLYNLVVIRNIYRPREKSTNFTVCVSPLNREYGDHADNTFQYGEFLEFIEVNRMFGADQFVMYNVSTGKSIEKHLQNYQKRRVIQLLPWHIPLYVEQDSKKEIFYYAQTLALNDCMYRHMYTSKYIAFIDFDEILVPLEAPSWMELIQGAGVSAGTYLFRNVFFRKEFEPDPESQSVELAQKLKLRTLLYTKREPKVWPAGQRSKYIVLPEGILVATVHTPQKSIIMSTHVFSENSALSYHYRNFLEFNQISSFVTDRRMYAFKDEILKRILAELKSAQ